ncbi:acyl carrier protein [Silvanigrella sp.]|jgi:acyl carrier protein|uniref:acyl carrier protein n=1 Tax=Silvanigrella sp. TaxID=2024976 RepID=UPI0037CB5425
MTNIINKLLPIFKSVFDDDNLILTSSTTANDIDGWDSLAHIRLIVAIEKFFNLRFSTSEISNLENVGQMANLILQKLPNE